MTEETTSALQGLRARWSEQYDERPRCPDGCTAGRTWHDGGRRRKATLRLDDVAEFVGDAKQRRKKCGQCGLRWVHRLEAISSRAHYQPCVVSHALAALGSDPDASTVKVAQQVGCAPSTVRRFCERVAALAEPAVLASAIVQEADETALPNVPVELVAEQRSLRLRAVLLRALTVLVLLETLGSLRGICPPALAHAHSLIPDNASGACLARDPPRRA